jgi:hypothetical protein
VRIFDAPARDGIWRDPTPKTMLNFQQMLKLRLTAKAKDKYLN